MSKRISSRWKIGSQVVEKPHHATLRTGDYLHHINHLGNRAPYRGFIELDMSTLTNMIQLEDIIGVADRNRGVPAIPSK